MNGDSSAGGRLAGRVAFVTGGSKGIGLAIAQTLAREGAAVAVSGRNAADLEQARASIGERAYAVAADVRDPRGVAEGIERAVRQYGGLDVLVNNAGIGSFGPVSDMTVEAWREVMETNLSGVFYCCRAAIPHLKQRGGGWIVNISSLAGKNPFADGAAYCASKAGLNAFSEALMQEVRHDNIRVSYVLPGSVATGFSGRGAAGAADWKIRPEDVGQVVLDLLLMPERSLPSRVELRPSRPVKS